MPDNDEIDLSQGLYKLNDFQKDFIFCSDFITGGYGGVGNGKTLAGCLKAMTVGDIYPGNRILIGRLTYPELKDTTEKQFLDIAKLRNGGTLEPGPYVASFKQNPDTLITTAGTEYLFRYLENEQSILNLNLGAFYVDQAEFVREEIFLHLISRLRRWTKEAQAQFERKYGYLPRHLGFITGNPAPGWVFKRFKQKRTDDGKPLNYTLFEASTAANKDNLPEGFIQNLLDSYPEDWVRRYVEGSWDTFSGQIYKELTKALHGVEDFAVPEHWPRTLGWDHGTVNPTAVSFVAIDESGYLVIYKEYYRSGAVLKDHAEAVISLCDKDAVKRSEDGKGVFVYMDPAIKGDSDGEGRDFRQLYQDFGIIGIPANNRVEAGIGKIIELLHPDPRRPFPEWHPRGEKRDKAGKVIKEAEYGSPKLFIFNSCKAHWHEWAMYRRKERKLGQQLNPFEEPVKYMDHTCDSGRYAISAIFENAIPAPKKTDRKPDPYLQMVYTKLLGFGDARG